MTDLFSGVSKC